MAYNTRQDRDEVLGNYRAHRVPLDPMRCSGDICERTDSTLTYGSQRVEFPSTEMPFFNYGFLDLFQFELQETHL